MEAYELIRWFKTNSCSCRRSVCDNAGTRTKREMRRSGDYICDAGLT